jgi:hypothetical protein
VRTSPELLQAIVAPQITAIIATDGVRRCSLLVQGSDLLNQRVDFFWRDLAGELWHMPFAPINDCA